MEVLSGVVLFQLLLTEHFLEDDHFLLLLARSDLGLLKLLIVEPDVNGLLDVLGTLLHSESPGFLADERDRLDLRVTVAHLEGHLDGAFVAIGA